MQTISAVIASHKLLLDRLRTARCIVDATAGNGNDTLYLATHSPATAKLYAFDIQQAALDAARQKLTAKNLMNKVSFILANHATLNQYIEEEVDVAMFNLGYLPGGDHTVTTVAKTTMTAITKVLDLLALNGLVAIIAYPGHDQGIEEYHALVEHLRKLPQRKFTVGCYRMINHAKTSPVLYLIEKVRS